MQKINIKKLTKEQILAMLEEAMSKQEAAEATAARHFEDGVKLAEENEKLYGQIGELTARIENVGKELDKVRAQYKAADQSAAALKQRNAVLTESIEQMNGEAINRANELTNLKADADALRNKLADAEAALGRVNAEITYSVTEKNELNAKIKQLDGERHYYKSRSDELDHYKNLLTNANEEYARIQGILEKVCCGQVVAKQRADYAESHPWRNLREWVKRKLVRHD